MSQSIMDVVNEIAAEADQTISDVRGSMSLSSTSRDELSKLYRIIHKYASLLEKAVEDLADIDAPEEDIDLAENLSERFGDLQIEISERLTDAT